MIRMSMRLGMADGRMFTQYIGSKFQNDNQKIAMGKEMGRPISNYEYRIHLEETGTLYYTTPPSCNSEHGITCYTQISSNNSK